MFKKKYIAVFLIRNQESFEILSKKRIKPTTKLVKYSDKIKIGVDTSIKTYSKGLNVYFLLDIKSKSQLFFYDNSEGVDSDVMDLVYGKEIIRQLTLTLNDTSAFKMNIVNVIIGIVLGAVVGFMVGNYMQVL